MVQNGQRLWDSIGCLWGSRMVEDCGRLWVVQAILEGYIDGIRHWGTERMM